MRRLALRPLASAMLLAGFATAPALAQGLPPGLDLSCLLAEDLAWLLNEEHGEVPVAQGLGADGALMTVFAARTTGTWTIALSDPVGVSCVVAQGAGFELLGQEQLALREGAAE